MVKKMLLFFALLCMPSVLWAQVTKLSFEKKQLLLKLSFNYYAVVKEGRVDLDSSLLLVGLRNHVGRWPVITEGFSNEFVQANNNWVETRRPREALKQLAGLHGTGRIRLLVLLGAYYTFQPAYRKADNDSATYYLLKAKQESEAINAKFWYKQSLCLLGKNYFKSDKVKEGTELFSILINDCQKSGDKTTEAKAWDYQGTYCPPTPATIMLKVGSLKKANGLYGQLNQPEKQINTLMNLGYLTYLLNDINSAESNALASLKLQKKLRFSYTHYTLNLLSLVYAQRSKADKELNCALKAVKSALIAKDSLGLGYFYSAVGHIIYGPEKTSLTFSNYWYKKAVAELLMRRDPAIYLALSNFVQNLTELNKPEEAIKLLNNVLKLIPPIDPEDKQFVYLSLANCYHSLRKDAQAERYYLMAYKAANQIPLVTRERHLSYLTFTIAQFYYDIKRYNKAKNLLLDFLASPTLKVNGKFMESQSQMLLYQIDSANKDYQSASKHLREFIRLNRTIVDSNDSKQIAGLKIQVLMTQKEKDLQILQARSNLQVQQASIVKKLIYAGIIVALLIIVMLYNRYYVNRKQKRQIDKKNNELQHVILEKDELLRSKEWLLKEVHHRVKNNLHTVTCLLESQALFLENDALKAIESSQHRIYAMSLIHQKLYQSDDIKTVEMAIYLPEFVGYLKDSLGTGNRISFELDIEPLKLGIAYAVPLSLIINEGVTNSIKYAFPDNRRGKISVHMHKFGSNVQVVIADNGIGMDTAQINSPSNSLGLKLLKGLTEDIQGTIALTNDRGTTIFIEFEMEAVMNNTI
jgi:two-component sensor histidine kinase